MRRPRAPIARLATLLSFASVLLLALRAEAGEGSMRLRVDWGSFARSVQELTAPTSSRVVETEHSPWMQGHPPSVVVSLVARNWEGASRLAGGPLPVTDAIRVSRSSRMLVGRVGYALGGVIPFVHAGVGQWREPDPHLTYFAPLEYAAQTGVGVELQSLVRRCTFAVEYDWTTLYREARPPVTTARRLGWGEAFAVLRWNFEASASDPSVRDPAR